MNLCIDSQSASIQCQPDSLDMLVDRLERNGYEPLLRKAAHNFSAVFNSSADDLLTNEEDDLDEAALQYEDRRRRLLHLEKLGYGWGFEALRSQARIPEIKGELFFTDDASGLLFVTMVETSKSKDGSQTICKIRIGLIGDAQERSPLKELSDSVSKVLAALDIECEWTTDTIQSQTYQELAKSGADGNIQPATSMSEKELRAAKVLENSNVREVAGLVRRAGVMLAKELLRQKPEQASEIIRHVDQLLQADLAHQEYVVVCSKTGAHVNRVESRDVIDQMARLGVHCSCGKPISEEQIEGLLASDALMPKMLDRNYWMAAMVVRLMNAAGVPSNKVLISNSPSNEDVELFADVDGNLVMIELKDFEFGLSQAYSLGTRIGVQRPQVAIIVSTHGISNDVKEHFKRLKAETQIVYVPNLLQLEPVIKKVVDNIRTAKVKAWLNYFQGLLNFPLASLMIPKLSSGNTLDTPHVVTSVQIQPEAQSHPAAARAAAPQAQAATAPSTLNAALNAAMPSASKPVLAQDNGAPKSSIAMPAASSHQTPVSPMPRAASTVPALPTNPLQPNNLTATPMTNSMSNPNQISTPMSTPTPTPVSTPSGLPTGIPTTPVTAATPTPLAPLPALSPADSLPSLSSELENMNNITASPSTALPSGLGGFGLDDEDFRQAEETEKAEHQQSPAML